MAYNSQGCVIRRESSVAGSTGAQESTNTIAFDSTNKLITRQAGFAAFTTGMRIAVQSSLNAGVWTIKTTAATALTVYEPLTAQASGDAVALTGHAMQNIGQVVSFNGPGITLPVIDVTNLVSSAREKLPGTRDPGQLSISVLWDNEASGANLHDALVRDMQARTKRWFDIKFSDNGTVEGQPSGVVFEGYITAFSPSGAVDNALKADITISLSSAVNFIGRV